MNWAVGLAEQIATSKLGQRVVAEFESMHDAWRTWAEVQHNDDGTHSNVTADSIATASLQPDPETADTSSIGAAYDSTNDRRSGPWQFIYGWAITAYNSLTLGANSEVAITVSNRSGEGSAAVCTKSINPFTDNAVDLGVALNPPGVSNAANRRWRHVAVANTIFLGTTNIRIRGGSGTPEGNVTGSPGDIWLRSGSGAGTSFYVKETGTGLTGWVAK